MSERRIRGLVEGGKGRQLTGTGRLSRGLSVVSWSLAGLVGLIAFFYFGFSADVSVKIIGGAAVAFGVWGFFDHGGAMITAAGMFTASMAAFVGYASLWWAFSLSLATPPSLLFVASSGYFVTVMMYHCFWWATRRPRVGPPISHSLRIWVFRVGAALVVVSLLLNLFGPDLVASLSWSGSVVGIVFLAASVSDGHLLRQLGRWQTMVLVLAMASYIIVVFEGFGRLSVIAVAAAAVALVSERHKRRFVKALSLLFLPVVISVLTFIRRLEVFGDAEISPEGGDSDVSGIWVFRELAELGSTLDYSWGESFFATATVWIPRALWESKPFGFGFELTLLLRPELAPAGHSMVATLFGEWYYSFGWLGMLLCIPVIGISIWFVDSLRERWILRGMTSPAEVVTYLYLLLWIGFTVLLVWGGTFSVVSRLLWPSFLLIAIYVSCKVFVGSDRLREKVVD